MALLTEDEVISTPTNEGKKKSNSSTKKSPLKGSAIKSPKRKSGFKVEEISTEKKPKKMRSDTNRNSFTVSDIGSPEKESDPKNEEIIAKPKENQKKVKTPKNKKKLEVKKEEIEVKEEQKSGKALKRKCHHCNELGHVKKECPNIGPEPCWRCGSSDHKLAKCPEKRTDTLPYIKCYLCTEFGHSGKNCPKKKENAKNAESEDESNPTNPNGTKKKINRFREQCFENRREKGMILLSSKVENKIYKLKNALRKKGLSEDEIKDIIRKRRRDEEIKYDRMAANKCFKCREIGHLLADCPLIGKDGDEAVEICFRCGSPEHKLSECKQKTTGLPFAKCYFCSEIGHLAKDCAQNERGVYPKGGECKVCQSVNHLAKDCPQNEKDKELEEEMTLGTVDGIDSVDAEIDDIKPKVKNELKQKIISF